MGFGIVPPCFFVLSFLVHLYNLSQLRMVEVVGAKIVGDALLFHDCSSWLFLKIRLGDQEDLLVWM
ncbi:hypothetical protein GLYMA_15G197651v4 [Glycine max]|nr:hypothetical protein GLYMA_15G197651v4 [Glycine max]